MIHYLGIGAARDAALRSKNWFTSLDAYINSMKADQELELARKTISQVAESALHSKTMFMDAAQRTAVEVYQTPLYEADIWSSCAGEWGQGPGFTRRVSYIINDWFDSRNDLKEMLEEKIKSLWENLVIAPLRRLAEEGAPSANIELFL